MLQKLIGPNFLVRCFWKPGATIREVLLTEKTEVDKLRKNDFVIIIACTNDTNPSEFKFWIQSFIHDIKTTNILFSSIPYNKYLNVSKLNFELKFYCLKGHSTNDVSFVEVNYFYRFPKRTSFLLYRCQVLVREILP